LSIDIFYTGDIELEEVFEAQAKSMSYFEELALKHDSKKDLGT
jgi:hypothetical protein